MIVAGIDIGNQTTEVVIARIEPGSPPVFLAHSIAATTGIKGTVSTIPGAQAALIRAATSAGIQIAEIDLVRISEAAPVVAGVAMQAIAPSILTDSTLIGHNPGTPGGIGLGVGVTVPIDELQRRHDSVIAIVAKPMGFEEAARLIREARSTGVNVTGAVVRSDDGVLIANRIGLPAIPIVDEVAGIERVPLGQLAAVEVASIGATIQTLCNPYGIATLFGLNAGATESIAPAARALTGLRSAVVVRTGEDRTHVRTIDPGSLTVIGSRGERTTLLQSGAASIRQELTRAGSLFDVQAEPGTSVGAMFGALRSDLSQATGKRVVDIRVADLFVADLFIPQPVAGGLSNEVAPERAVALAAMIEADSVFSTTLAESLSQELGIRVETGGKEADAGLRGALTTPGAGLPLCVLDLGSGSTNAARIDTKGKIDRLHLAGGGAMVNLLIGEELGIADPVWREEIKRNRVARAESLFTLRHEDGSIEFLAEPFGPNLFGQTLLLHPEGVRVVPGNLTVERIVATRKRAKLSVFGSNAKRALHALAPGGNPRFLRFVALIGGSALDFELPGMLAEQLGEYGIVTGAANVRGSLGPRNAAATGLVVGEAKA